MLSHRPASPFAFSKLSPQNVSCKEINPAAGTLAPQAKVLLPQPTRETRTPAPVPALSRCHSLSSEDEGKERPWTHLVTAFQTRAMENLRRGQPVAPVRGGRSQTPREDLRVLSGCAWSHLTITTCRTLPRPTWTPRECPSLWASEPSGLLPTQQGFNEPALLEVLSWSAMSRPQAQRAKL